MAFLMAGFGATGPCGCCGEGGETCGPTCTVCGSDYVLNYEGTFTDDNGSGVIGEFFTTQNLNVGRTANPGGGDKAVWTESPLTGYGVKLATGKLSATGRVVPVGGSCPGETGDVSYAWGLRCGGETGIEIVLAVDVRVDCSLSDPHVLAYNKATRMQGVATGYDIKEAEVTCDDGVLTATASGWEIPASIFDSEVTIAPPSSTVTITVPLNVPVEGFCCLPCPVPKADLTMSGFASGTLVYNSGDNTWSDGTYTLTCADRSSRIYGPGGLEWTIDADATKWDCSPFHQEHVRSGNRIYVDE